MYRLILPSLTLAAWVLVGPHSLTAQERAESERAESAAQAAGGIDTQPADDTAAEAAANENAANIRYWTTNWSFEEIDVGKLMSRLRAIGLEIPIAVRGDVSVSFSVSIPLNRLREPRVYRFYGQIQSPRLRVEELQLEAFSAEVNYANGVLSLPNLEGRWIDLASSTPPAGRQTSRAGAATSETSAAASETNNAQNLEGKGSFEGQGRVELVPRGDIQLKVTASELSLDPLVDLWIKTQTPQSLRPSGGVLNGSLRFQAPLEQIEEVSLWNLQGDLQLTGFRVGPSPPLSADTGPIRIEQGVIRAEEVDIRWSAIDNPDQIRAQLNLNVMADLLRQQAFQFDVRGNDIPLDTLSDFGFDDSIAAGKVDLIASGTGELANEQWDVDGRVASTGLVLFDQELGVLEHRFEFDSQQLRLTPLNAAAADDFDAMRIKEVTSQYELTDSALRIDQLTAALYGGTIEGTATLARLDAATHRFDLNWRDINPEIDLDPFLGISVILRAATSGQVQWQVPAGKIDQPAAHEGTLQIDLDQITLAGALVGELQMVARAQPGPASQGSTLSLEGEGQIFGGTVTVETKNELTAADSWNDLFWKARGGEIRFGRVNLAPVMRALRPRETRRWSGRLSGEISLPTARQGESAASDANAIAAVSDAAAVNGAAPVDDEPSGDGQAAGNEQTADTNSPSGGSIASQPDVELDLRVDDLAIDGRRIARRLDAQLDLADGVVRIERATGSYAGGRLWAEGRWALTDAGPHQVQVRLSSIRAGEALLAISPTAAEFVEGRVSGWLNVSKSDLIRLRGAITARDSALFSIPTGTVNTGVTATVASNLSRWRVSMPSINGELARGRITGDAVLSSSTIRPGAFDLASSWQARKVDFGILLAAAQSESQLAHGRLTGELNLGGRGIRGVQELRGDFAARMNGTDAAAIPGLLQANRYLGLISIGGTQFNEGVLQGRIAGGAARIDSLLLQSRQVQVLAEGRIRLADARMNLDMILSTGTFPASAELLAFGTQLALQAITPISTVLEINELITDRTLYLKVEGSLADPRIRLKPLETLRSEALRLLIRETLVAAAGSEN